MQNASRFAFGFLGTASFVLGTACFHSTPALAAPPPTSGASPVVALPMGLPTSSPRSVTGRVLDADGKPIAYATVELPDLRRAVQADSVGAFALRLAPGMHRLRARRTGFEPGEVWIDVAAGTSPAPVEVRLVAKAILAKPVVVHAARRVEPPAPQPGRHAIEHDAIDRQIGGFEDVMRTVQSKPGVGTASDLQADFFVRGSESTSNSILLDGLEIPFPFHILGFNSIFDPGLIESAELWTGGTPAEYGNATGGVLALRGRGAAPQAERFAAGLSYLSGHVRAAAGGSRLGFAATARRSHQDKLLQLLGSSSSRLVPVFHDVFLRGRWQPARGQMLSGTLLWAGDGLSLPKPELSAQDLDLIGVDGPDRASVLRQYASVRDQLELHNDLWLGSLAWRAVLGDRAYLETTLGILPLRFDFSLQGDNHESVGLRSNRTTLRQDLTWRPGSHRTKTGWMVWREDVSRHVFSYAGILTLRDTNSAINLLDLKERYEFDRSHRRVVTSAYVQDDWSPVEHWTFGGGLRLEHDGLAKQSLVSPQLSTEWRLHPKLALRSTLGVYHDLRDEPMEVLPTVTGAPLGAERSLETTVGATLRVAPELTAGASLYAKRLDRLVYEPRPALYANGGEARARGLEFSTSWMPSDGKRRASLTYSWSHVRERDPEAWHREANYRATQPDSFWGPVYETPYWYRPAQDTPHRLGIEGSTRVWGWDFGLRYQLTSGRPYTPVEWVATDPLDLKYGIVGHKGSARYPAFRRLDFRLQRSMQRGSWHYNLYADVLNVTGTDNVFQYRYDSRYRVRYAVKMLPTLPTLGFEARF